MSDLEIIQKWIIRNIANFCSVNIPIKINDLEEFDRSYERMYAEIEDSEVEESRIVCLFCDHEFEFDHGKLPIPEIIDHAKGHIAKGELNFQLRYGINPPK